MHSLWHTSLWQLYVEINLLFCAIGANIHLPKRNGGFADEQRMTKEELNAGSEMMKQNSHMGFEEFCQALAQNQPVSFDLRERNRKELVKDISEILGEKAE